MKKKTLSPTRIIMLGFLLGALIGAILLYFPLFARAGEKVRFVDALFLSTSSICVTGLSTVNVGTTFNIFGQIIILILIQMGGLGVVTFSTLLLILLRKRITLQDRLLLQSAYNLDTLSGLVKITIRIVKLTLVLEIIGSICYSFVFVPQYGPIGIWYSIFHSVSAFCNAGIDILGGNSFCAYRDNVIVNFTTMFLIIAGGLGFPVVFEITSFFSKKADKKKLSFHARLVINITIILIILGALVTLIIEYNNPDTIGGLSFPKKLMASLFQSVTLRTAGFATIDQALFKPSSAFIYIFFMFVGGSPSGTAGGVKTVTIALLLASVISNIKGRKNVSIMKRNINDTVIRRCVAIISFSLIVLIFFTSVMLVLHPNDIMSVFYEVGSAIGTVGLSRGLTGELTEVGKLIISLAMYLGRIGPITLALAFNTNKNAKDVSYADAKVIIG